MAQANVVNPAVLQAMSTRYYATQQEAQAAQAAQAAQNAAANVAIEPFGWTSLPWYYYVGALGAAAGVYYLMTKK